MHRLTLALETVVLLFLVFSGVGAMALRARMDPNGSTLVITTGLPALGGLFLVLLCWAVPDLMPDKGLRSPAWFTMPILLGMFTFGTALLIAGGKPGFAMPSEFGRALGVWLDLPIVLGAIVGGIVALGISSRLIKAEPQPTQ